MTARHGAPVSHTSRSSGPANTDSTAASSEFDVSMSVPVPTVDISRLLTQLLDPPAYLRSLLPTQLLPPTPPSAPPPAPTLAAPPASSVSPARTSPHATHPPLPPHPAPTHPAPEVPSSATRAPQSPTEAIAEHLQAAQRLRVEEQHVLDALNRCSAEANVVTQRWFGLMHTEPHSSEQTALHAQLEAQVLALSQQLARLRQRHAACHAAAHAREAAAEALQTQQTS